MVDIKDYMMQMKYQIFPEFMKMDEKEIDTFRLKVKRKQVAKLSYRDWFWLHPSAYKLLYYGKPVLTFLMFGVGGAILCWKLPDKLYWGIISMLVAARFIYKHFKTPYSEGYTHYDKWFSNDVAGVD